jgi:uncharacterized protein (TIGR00369 family)
MSEHIAASYRHSGIFANLGLEVEHSEPGRVVASLVVGPQHRNRSGLVHGGILCTMIDFAACGAGLHSEPGEPLRFAVTQSLTTHFTKATKAGRLRVEGLMIKAGRKSYSAQARVEDEAGDLLAHGIGTFQWMPDSRPVTAPAS